MSSGAILENLRTRGHRIGKARRAIVEYMTSYHMPITAIDLQQALASQGKTFNKTTIYRELSFLSDQHIVRAIKLTSDALHYEVADKSHHHHMICTKCNDIDDITVPRVEESLQRITNEKQHTHQFLIQRHTLEFYGICAQCQ